MARSRFSSRKSFKPSIPCRKPRSQCCSTWAAHHRDHSGTPPGRATDRLPQSLSGRQVKSRVPGSIQPGSMIGVLGCIVETSCRRHRWLGSELMMVAKRQPLCRMGLTTMLTWHVPASCLSSFKTTLYWGQNKASGPRLGMRQWLEDIFIVIFLAEMESHCGCCLPGQGPVRRPDSASKLPMLTNRHKTGGLLPDVSGLAELMWC